MAETVLIVDDEESVRRTFREWLRESDLGCEILTAADSRETLEIASNRTIDLAVLDWHLNEGRDGLQLLQDIVQFQPDVVAIMVTGYAHQATPLDALRMGVRDYLDKNQTLNRDSFLSSVRRQLERIIPAKRQREFNHRLASFRETLEQVLPLVESVAALNDPVPLPEAVRGLFRFVIRTTRAQTGVLVVRQPGESGTDEVRVFDPEGELIEAEPFPFSRSLAASVLSMQEPVGIDNLADSSAGLELQSFEEGHTNVLAAPIPIGGETQAVVELFDSPGGFTADDRAFLASAVEFGTELLRQALSQRRSHQLLLDAVDAALKASEEASTVWPAPVRDTSADPPRALDREDSPHQDILNRLREGLGDQSDAPISAQASIRLAESIRELAVRHGAPAVEHCRRLIENVRELLDSVTGPLDDWGHHRP